ncbi:MAG: glutamate-semialdehyde -aminomutase [Solirubrobacteraceae bacterium]|jgi:glutamate-1-semialdehyde 2,1-aminomutase|nr:glutamate-semialdehyde -aminomutase [Solirubrobacteraceae bacterium]MEA2392699.1 glutamate-semialdehyde -aminomutase [Solirubrobacteraceae bacterium]
MATVTASIDRGRVLELTGRERERLLDRTDGSRVFYERAVAVMPRGVPSSFQAADPRPIYLSHGEGARVWDVDANEYLDFHNGFGVMCVGHANPAIVDAVAAQAARGSHFAAPTEGSIAVAEELRRRFGMPQWRFTNSGTESTMDAIHLARAATGRDVVLKIEGSYHGHHDAVMVSVRPPLDQLGERGAPGSVPFGAGHPRAVTELTMAIPFNDADVLARVLQDMGDRVAALILEPAMMNITIVGPRPGYLERVRELTAEHGVVLIFDEVKTGCTIAAGGAVERFGVVPDVVCLAKAIAGGYPGGAIGMTETLADLITAGSVRQVGTFNGNPLVMAAAQAALTEVLTPAAYERFEAMDARLRAGLDDVIERHGLPCHTIGLGAKGCVVFASDPLYEYRDYATKVDEELSTLSWLYHMNHGIFMTPGVDEQWTLSVLHADEDLQRYVDAFEAFARDVTAS